MNCAKEGSQTRLVQRGNVKDDGLFTATSNPLEEHGIRIRQQRRDHHNDGRQH
jgi:hypothetical protein